MLLTATVVYQDEGPHRVVLYKLSGVNSGDTFDASDYFKKIIRAKAMQVSTALADFDVTITMVATIITLTALGLDNDDVVVLCHGASA